MKCSKFQIKDSEQLDLAANFTQAVPPTMGTALGPVNYGARTPVPKDWKIVGWVIEMAC